MEGPRSPGSGLADVLVRAKAAAGLAAALAVVTGGIEAVVFAVRRNLLGHLSFVSPDYAWMTPLAYVALTVPATVLVVLAARACRRPIPAHAQAGLVAGVLTFSLLLPYGALAWWASTLLAAGIGVQIVRIARTRPGAFKLWLGRLAWVVVAVVTLEGVGTRTWRAMEERSVGRALAPPPAGAPNILLIVLDTVRASNLGAYGYARDTTPVLERVASEGALFEHAMATAPWTLPSHGSLFTGLSASATHGDWLVPVRDDVPTLPEMLGTSGYRTAGFVANLLYTAAETGLARGFQHYDDYIVTPAGILSHSPLTRIDLKSDIELARSWTAFFGAAVRTHVESGGRLPADITRPADQVAAAFLDWQAAEPERPFFAFLNFFDAHAPRRPDPALLARFGGQHPKPVDGYDAAIAWMDHVIGTTLEALSARGLLDRTIVVITGDHGEQFGEHGLDDHANSLYLPLLQVPLIIRYPAGVPAGRHVDTAVSLRDVPETLLDLASIGRHLPGRSLAATWRGSSADVSAVVAELNKALNKPPAASELRREPVELVRRPLALHPQPGWQRGTFRLRRRPG